MGRPKQVLAFRGKPLLLWVLEAALAAGLDRVVLVLGHEAPGIARTLGGILNHPRLDTTLNPEYPEGMASSLRVGLLRVMDRFASVMFLLGDQPLLDPQTIDLLLRRFWSSSRNICVPMHQGVRGNPVLLASPYYPRILALRGDAGARRIIEENPQDVLRVEVRDGSVFYDIDREEDLRLGP
jgi:molybdenum cofactor cytidylyltransferase